MCSLCYVFIFSLLLAVTSVHAAPIATRDQNPLIAGFGLTSPLPENLNAMPTWDAQFNWASSAIVQNSNAEHLTVDAETKELRLVLAHAWNDRWGARLQLPYRDTSGGSLDGFIDDWHDWFGLPKGVRPQQPHDRLLIDYSRDGFNRVHVTDRSSGIGDITLDVGHHTLRSVNTNLTLWASIKLPTGNANDLTGSGAADESIAAAFKHRLGPRWSLSAQLAGTHLGKADLLPSMQKRFVASGLLAANFAVTSNTEFTAQIDAHTAAYDSDLEFLGSAEILTLGGAHRFNSGWRLELGVSEDIAVDASPDVVFLVRISQARSAHKD
jgi:hypothetical protein